MKKENEEKEVSKVKKPNPERMKVEQFPKVKRIDHDGHSKQNQHLDRFTRAQERREWQEPDDIRCGKDFISRNKC